ncbi:uncharacterized protein SCHCODRAFT_02196274 [Schizophyllum commune H4-8]|uniref:uncharacterized protein n=1 Tax=Schizophyllum commune (strain H4-8 / FGSC 9210) TaxID=578458 RepID=UPI00215E2BA4|nr:uncharacterized protein SCHCODRAFT_02196274 [Schizophyllum commune H4-8]KAI5896669.1 hypothetical protein SCHCODRAFT_02196274 [Schizophyllum commune H4-8]
MPPILTWIRRPAGGHSVGHRYYPPLGPCPRRSVNRCSLACYLLASPTLSLAGIPYVTIAQDHQASYRLPTASLSLTAPKPNPSHRPHPDLSFIRVQKRSYTYTYPSYLYFCPPRAIAHARSTGHMLYRHLLSTSRAWDYRHREHGAPKFHHGL